MILDSVMLAIMSILAVLYTSWVLLFFWPYKKPPATAHMPISIIIPAYNEEKNIEHTLTSVLNTQYTGIKEIIVVDDGSVDNTAQIVKRIAKKNKSIRLVKGEHRGKGNAVNLGIKNAKNDFVAVLDADTEIQEDALLSLFQPFSDEKVGAVSTVLRVKKSRNILNWFQQLDYAVSSSWRHAIDKINGSCIVPGFCAFRKSAFLSVGGFRGDSAVEDYDICMYLRKAGYKIKMAPDSVAYTKVPETMKGLIKQRTRWSRGTLQVIRKHNDMLLSRSVVGSYSVPTQLYWFFHAFFYMPLVTYQIVSGYFKWFVSQGSYLTYDVAVYFIKWLTTIGMVDFIYNVYTGAYPLNTINVLTIFVFSLSFGFAVFSLIRFSRKITAENIFAMLLFFPYTTIMLSVYIYAAYRELTAVDRGEKWEKEK